jgi:hypothetical protein
MSIICNPKYTGFPVAVYLIRPIIFFIVRTTALVSLEKPGKVEDSLDQDMQCVSTSVHDAIIKVSNLLPEREKDTEIDR